MSKLEKCLKEAIATGHISNASRGHEQWFEDLLKKHGFKQTSVEDVGLTNQDVRDQVTSNDNKLFFIAEPLGSQNTPDFLVSDEEGNLIYIELKSSKGEKITWNGGYPKDNFIYLFSTGKHKAQTVFLGSDSWPSEDKKLLMEHAAKLKELTDKFNKELGGDQSYYTRNMFNDNTKYYSREGREQYEQTVFDFLSELQKKEEAA